jgi:phage gpG-like protein
MNFQQFTDKTLKDIEIKATELFDRNFEQQGFFGTKWKERKDGNNGRAILMGVGRLRGGVKTPKRNGNSIVWSFDVPYAKAHNEGLKRSVTIPAHERYKHRGDVVKEKYINKSGKVSTRKIKVEIKEDVRSHKRKMNIPQRQFIGNHPILRLEIKRIIDRNAKKLMEDFKNNLKK